jgi:hypothetical protein
MLRVSISSIWWRILENAPFYKPLFKSSNPVTLLDSDLRKLNNLVWGSSDFLGIESPVASIGKSDNSLSDSSVSTTRSGTFDKCL